MVPARKHEVDPVYEKVRSDTDGTAGGPAMFRADHLQRERPKPARVHPAHLGTRATDRVWKLTRRQDLWQKVGGPRHRAGDDLTQGEG